jgi:hypothetical protein
MQIAEMIRKAWVQELLSHPFLRPTAAPAAPLRLDSAVGLTRAQLKKVLAQVCPDGS